MEQQSKFLTTLLVLGMMLGAALCVWRISAGPQTGNEAILLSVILTIFSVVASWTASRYYANSSFNRSLKLFALKAAEKVTNLSNELDRLSVFLREELKSDYDSPPQTLLARNLRIESAIHVINTLKSVNDKSLSDWQGVIGEEISAQREMQEEREESLRELLERLELVSVPSPEDPLRTEVDSIKKDVQVLAAQITGMPVARKLSRGKQSVQKLCPQCGSELRYQQRVRPGGIKAVTCTQCGASLYSEEMDGSFEIKPRSEVGTQISCPACGKSMVATVDPVPGTAKNLGCESCGAPLRALRTSKGVRIKLLTPEGMTGRPNPILGEELLRRVESRMGPQPWPKGRSREVAEQLGVSHSIVHQATQQLIRRGVFKLQVDGKIYVPTGAGSDGE